MGHKHNLMTVNALNMINIIERAKSNSDGENSDAKVHEFDFNNHAVYETVVSDIQEYNDTALFYQAKKILGDNNADLSRYIIYVDFNGVFRQAKEDDGEVDAAGKRVNYKAEQSEKRIKTAKELINNGFKIKFTDSDSVHFMAFDKSSSMARNARMTFASTSNCKNGENEEPFRKLLDKRVMLDMDFSGIKLSLSKLYAYRGLMLSEAERVDLKHLYGEKADKSSDDIILEKAKDLAEKIIVLDLGAEPMAGEQSKETVGLITAKPQDPQNNDNRHWKLSSEEKYKKEKNIDRYDGEGLISEEWSKKINENHRKELEGASSYQVRMPFVKGMLHEVDFKKFFKNETAFLNTSDENTKIKDAYDTPRELYKAEIILTKSMFKCFDWLKEYWKSVEKKEEYSNDPMVFYFSKLLKYDHALYISNTNLMLHNNGKVPLNYQFITPMKLDKEKAQKLFNNHYDNCHEYAVYNIMHGSTDAAEKKNETTQNDSESNQGDASDSNQPWIKVAKMCGKNELNKTKNLLRDSKIKSMISSSEESLKRDASIGKIMVRGECRFLSRDLIAMMYSIAKKCEKPEDFKLDDEKSEEILNCTLETGTYYMPGMLDKKAAESAFLRNPHLSRNEECVLRKYHNNTDKKNTDKNNTEKNNAAETKAFYSEYLGHLKGIVMVPYNSLVPMALSGADFDGDLVKVIHEEEIVSAIKSGVNKDDGERKLYTIDIPSIASKKVFPKCDDNGMSVDVGVIQDTFDSSVGHISNLAVKFAKNDNNGFDGQSKKNESTENDTAINYKIGATDSAFCTILTGLEIDACKNGCHPSLDEINKKSKDLSDSMGVDGQDYFIKFKDTLSTLSKYGKGWEPKEDGGNYKLYRNYQNRSFFTVKANPDATIDNFPYWYCEKIYNEKNHNENNADKNEPEKSETKAVKNRIYIFSAKDSNDKNNESNSSSPDVKKVSNSIKLSVKDIMTAYNDVMKRASDDYRREQNAKNARYAAKIYGILQLQYDSLYLPFPSKKSAEGNDEKTVDDVFKSTYDFINEKFKNKEETEEILKALIDENWQYKDKNSRLEFLNKHIFVNSDNENNNNPDPDSNSDEKEMLSNFSEGGYFLLYYMIKSALCNKLTAVASKPEPENDTVNAAEQSVDAADQSDNVSEQSADAKRFSYDVMKIYDDARHAKKTKKTWNKEIVRKCKAEIAKIKKSVGYSKCLEEVYRNKELDKNRDFFWSMFEPDEIYNCLNTKYGSEESKNEPIESENEPIESENESAEKGSIELSDERCVEKSEMEETDNAR